MTNHSSKVTRNEKLADKTVGVWFEKPIGFDFKPGQFVNITLAQDDVKITHCMTIASTPHEPELLVAARLTGSAYKNILEKLKPGDTIDFSKPLGSFTLQKSKLPAVFIAGGIGITPFLSILKDAEENKSARQFVLFYFNKEKSGATFLTELSALQLPNYNFIPVMTDDVAWPGEHGYLTETLLKKHLNIKQDDYYVVGPPRMVKESVELLKKLSVPNEQIKSEEFIGYN
ncbi:MAG: FAD-dependent oxidoreductase [Patescibacteria group bacterium]